MPNKMYEEIVADKLGNLLASAEAKAQAFQSKSYLQHAKQVAVAQARMRLDVQAETRQARIDAQLDEMLLRVKRIAALPAADQLLLRKGPAYDEAQTQKQEVTNKDNGKGKSKDNIPVVAPPVS
jgi:hypothetical protein